MPKGSRNDSQLPSPYINPWYLLRKNIRAVLADLRLRFKEFWRRILKGDLTFRETLFSPFGFFSWPLLLIVIAITIFLFRNSTIDLLSIQKISKSEPLEVKQVNQDGGRIGLLHNSNSSPVSSSLDELELISHDELYPEVQISESDLMSLILGKDATSDNLIRNLLQNAEIISSNNSVLVIVGAEWSKLNFSEKVAMSEKLLARIQGLGFAGLRLKDYDDNLLARTPFLGKDMIVFD